MGATMSDLADRLKGSVISVTKDWAKQRKAEERHASAAANRRARLCRASDYYNFKSAAFEVMEEAYLAASANGKLSGDDATGDVPSPPVYSGENGR